jgi:hypothetical protein
MIPINRLYDFLTELQLWVNNEISNENWVLSDGVWVDDDHWIDNGHVNTKKTLGKVIDSILISPTESHLGKKIKDRAGIVLAVKMPDADTEYESIDNYSEHNHQLWFLLEKINTDSVKDATERMHYTKMQSINRLVKQYIIEHGMNTTYYDGEETLSKPFRTEFEYQVFGGFNGVSTSFDLQDFEL